MKNKIINKMIAVMCAVGMSLGGAVVSVGAVGPKSVDGQQLNITKEEAQKRFNELRDKLSEKRDLFLEWDESKDINLDFADYNVFMDASNAANDLRDQIYDGEDKNTLDEQIKLINEYEGAVNKCIKIMEDCKTKYEEIVKENQMSIININKINKEKSKEEDEKQESKSEELANRKNELQNLYNKFTTASLKWKDFINRIEFSGENVQDKFLTDRFKSCKNKFSKLSDNDGNIDEDELIEFGKKYIDDLVRDVNTVILHSEDFMNKYDKSELDDFVIYSMNKYDKSKLDDFVIC